jgi:hypothetical protein
MIEKTKIDLSAKELQLVCDKEWILTKQLIIEKVYRLFGTLAISMQQQVLKNIKTLPITATRESPKISRGENYRSLPYVMLDYPRHFSKESTLAIRTFFWWGNFFSINLHLAGVCKEAAIPSLKANFAVLQHKGYSICINETPWQHHFEEDNYVAMNKFTANDFAAMLNRESFIKIAKCISLQQWEEAPEFLEQHFYEMMMLLHINFPTGERDPLPGIPIIDFGP